MYVKKKQSKSVGDLCRSLIIHHCYIKVSRNTNIFLIVSSCLCLLGGSSDAVLRLTRHAQHFDALSVDANITHSGTLQEGLLQLGAASLQRWVETQM